MLPAINSKNSIILNQFLQNRNFDVICDSHNSFSDKWRKIFFFCQKIFEMRYFTKSFRYFYGNLNFCGVLTCYLYIQVTINNVRKSWFRKRFYLALFSCWLKWKILSWWINKSDWWFFHKLKTELICIKITNIFHVNYLH